MNRGILISFGVCVALKSVYLLPTQDFVKPNTAKNTERLNNLGPNDYAYLYSGQFEGDMVMSSEEIEELLSERGGRTTMIDERFKWTDNVVPYHIKEADFTLAQINYITLGVQRIMDATCIKFVKYNPAIHSNYVEVTGENSGCWSFVGMRGGRQQLNLQLFAPESGCFRLYTIVHEFIHALGFYHMQSATERDEYVEILWENIQPGMEHNFNKYGPERISQYGVEYDYGSVMHYPPGAFSINDQPTIIALKDTGEETMGQTVRMSDKDIARLNAKYCPVVDNRPKNLFQLFADMNQKMNKLFKSIFK